MLGMPSLGTPPLTMASVRDPDTLFEEVSVGVPPVCDEHAVRMIARLSMSAQTGFSSMYCRN
jgi:hypothetical protein